MIKLDLKEILDEKGKVRRLNFPRSAQYKENLKKNIETIATLSKRCDFLKSPSHFSFESTNLDRHVRKGERINVFLDEECVKAKTHLSPFIRLGHPELRGGVLLSVCRCLRRDGMQVNCRRRGCRGRPQCTAGVPGLPRVFGEAVEPTCCESWHQRAVDAARQLKMRHFEKAAKEAERLCQALSDRCLLNYTV